MHRSTCLAIAVAVVAALAAAPRDSACAAGFPEKDIAFVIPDGPGGGFDSYVRAIGPALQKYLPNPVAVVPTNVPGAGGTRAAIELFRAKPDGYTIGIFNVPGIYIQQQTSGGFDLAKFTWLGRVGVDHYGLAVAEASPIRTVADLATLSRRRPIKFTSTGPAGTAYSATLIAAKLLGIDAQIITGYKGSSDYVVGAIRGDGDAVVTVLPTLRHLGAGKTLRIIADFEATGTVPGAADATALGQPELAQIVLDRLIAAPPGVPAAVKRVLAAALSRALADPQVIAWAKQTDNDLAAEMPDEAVATLHAQLAFYDKWKPLLRAK